MGDIISGFSCTYHDTLQTMQPSAPALGYHLFVLEFSPQNKQAKLKKLKGMFLYLN